MKVNVTGRLRKIPAARRSTPVALSPITPVSWQPLTTPAASASLPAVTESITTVRSCCFKRSPKPRGEHDSNTTSKLSPGTRTSGASQSRPFIQTWGSDRKKTVGLETRGEGGRGGVARVARGGWVSKNPSEGEWCTTERWSLWCGRGRCAVVVMRKAQAAG